ncbi:MAG: hypothetical protein HN712_27615 [Gemmatimonadetes bacterium]|jgi:hypothetical protein|nr:hypothetical protein [Gemmatimonadota bacterium]MBT7864110.1 hypothetical protein [Gemmatimonadota bacterium]
MSHPRRLIWFCQTEHVAKHPEQLAMLRDEIGLTTIMPESPVCHTSGFRARDDLGARGPFQDWRDRVDAWPKAAEGIYPPVAGVIGGFDDGDLRRVLDAARAANIEVWGHIGLWSYGGDVYPEHALRTIDGDPLNPEYKRWGVGLCPSREEINSWTADGLVDIAERYEVDGFCVDHARYPQPASPSALMSCGCASCVEEGEGLGFDVPALHDAIRQSLASLRTLDAGQLQQLAKARLPTTQLLQALGASPMLPIWFQLRSALLARQMHRFRARVREVNGDLLFGSDIFAPSVGPLGGHDLPRWEESTDYLTGGSSAGGVVGWATGATNAAAEWARALAVATGLDEGAWLELTLQLLGIADLDLPRDVAALDEARDLPIEALYDREVARLVARSSGLVPLYPPISAGGDPARTRQLCRSIVENGAHGAMVSLAPDRPETLAAVREGLAGL